MPLFLNGRNNDDDMHRKGTESWVIQWDSKYQSGVVNIKGFVGDEAQEIILNDFDDIGPSYHADQFYSGDLEEFIVDDKEFSSFTTAKMAIGFVTLPSHRSIDLKLYCWKIVILSIGCKIGNTQTFVLEIARRLRQLEVNQPDCMLHELQEWKEVTKPIVRAELGWCVTLVVSEQLLMALLNTRQFNRIHKHYYFYVR